MSNAGGKQRSGPDGFQWFRVWLALPIFCLLSARSLLRWLLDLARSDEITAIAASLDVMIDITDDACTSPDATWSDFELN